MLQIQLISLFFEDMQDNVEEVLMLVHKLLRELQSLFQKIYIVPAAKRIAADLFEIAARKIGEIVSGRKQTQTICKRCKTAKQFGKNWEVKKIQA